MITGSRRGEVSALRWHHVDFDRATLWVHRSNAQTKAGIKEKETKTGQRRKLALDPYTLVLLSQHRELWEHRCADLECALDPDAFVFSPAPDGSTPDAADLRVLHAVLGPADRAAARTAAELIVERGFARGRPLTALTEAFLAG